MAAWTYPTTEIIDGNTKIREADNKIQNAMNDLQDWLNGAGTHTGVGFKDDADAYMDTLFSTLTEDTVVVEW